MTYTHEDLRRQAQQIMPSKTETAKMLEAGADAIDECIGAEQRVYANAMEAERWDTDIRIKEASNQAIEEAAEVADKRVDEMNGASIPAVLAMLGALPDAILAIKEKTE